MTDPTPFDDIRRLIDTMPGPDREATAAIAAREARLTKPAGALGRMEQLVAWLGAWQAKAVPTLDRPLVCVFAGSHGVTKRGVSAFPDAVNRQMLDNFAAGGAAINQICAAYGLGFKVFDLAIDLPTGDITEAAALDEKATVATMAFGMEAVAAGTDCVGIGEMGIGNTTIAAALYTALFGGQAAHWVGRGTGLDEAGIARKVAAVEAALAYHAGHLDDPLEILRRLGGREVAAMAGAIIAARLQRVPVVIDGYVATAAAAVLHAIDPRAPRPLPRRPCLGRGRPCRGAGAPRIGAAAGARHAAGRRLGRGDGDGPAEGRARLPSRHGDVRAGRRLGQSRPGRGGVGR